MFTLNDAPTCLTSDFDTSSSMVILNLSTSGEARLAFLPLRLIPAFFPPPPNTLDLNPFCKTFILLTSSADGFVPSVPGNGSQFRAFE